MALEISLLVSQGREIDEVCVLRSFTVGSGENVKKTHEAVFLKQACFWVSFL